MGWYDAFRGNTTHIDVSKATGLDDSFKQFGDAFKDIGTMLYNGEIEKEKTAVRDLQKEQAQLDLTTKKTTNEQQKIDDAYRAEALENDNRNVFNILELGKGKNKPKPSSDALKFAKDYFQGIDNDTAFATAIRGGYDGFDAFKNENPSLIKNADAATLGKIHKFYLDKDNEAGKIDSKIKDLKHEEEKLKLQTKLSTNTKESAPKLNKDLIDLQNSIAKEYGSYDEVTGKFVIDDDKKDEAQFALDYGSQLLSDGNLDLTKIRLASKEAYKNKKKADKDPLKIGL